MSPISHAAPRTISVPAHVPAPFRGGMASVEQIDVRGLEARLRRTLEGEVRFDASARALYATDASNFRQPPIGVVVPKSFDDVEAIHAACRAFGAPITSRGAGTGLAGQTVNFAVIVDHSKYLNRILEIDPDAGWVHVESGAINGQVNAALAPYGLVFPPDPATHGACTIGGNVGNNSCGVHSVQGQLHGHGPRTSDNLHSLEVLTYDGERLWVGATSEAERERIVRGGGRAAEIVQGLADLAERHGEAIRARYAPVETLPRRVSGYNLDELLPERGFHLARALAGTEATCATVLSAKLLLTRNVAARTLLVVGFPDIAVAGDAVPRILGHRPIALEGIDRILFRHEQQFHLHAEALAALPEGDAWLLIELGGATREESDQRARELVADLRGAPGACAVSFAIFDDPRQEQAIWAVRKAGLGATAFSPTGEDHWPGWEDSAVPPDRVGDYLRDLKRLYAKHELNGAVYGHLGQGCVHSRISFDLKTADGIRRYRAFLEEAADLVVGYGGSISGEHGDGQQRAELLAKQYGPELVDAMRSFKRLWDPDWKMNPGKVVDAYRFDENLKLGVDYHPPHPPVHFRYPEDGGDFAHAMLRCVGVGRCRIPDGDDVMCPSYVATREEEHTTRGRARLLFEMLEGGIVTDGWRSPEVKRALDLCLGCKGCTHDCPVHVDMPTYKAEFLSHHWAGRLRPRHAYAFGYIDRVAQLAAWAPELANGVGQTPGLATLAKLAAGATRERDLPAFAPLSLQQWFARRGGTRHPRGRRVVLWPDTFNNYFHTEVGVAAVEALEAAGCRVVLPRGHVCCGRPLYDYGFLDRARRRLERSLAQLRDEIRAGTPVVGMEPSCVATFKDELAKMLPDDEDARRLRHQVFHFAEFFERELVERDHVALPSLDRRLLLWGHCHQRATGGVEPEEALLRRMGLDVETIRGGCCGLAGSWGYEAGHHALSLQCGEQALLPAVRAASPETVIVADGFSCRMQIASTTERGGLHVAQVLRLASGAAARGAPGERPEAGARAARPEPTPARRAVRVGGAMLGAIAGAAAGVAIARRLRGMRI
ncbi:MAG: FAD-binding and (Fe-S)-binding domain-containing protein [Myxococcota bacterium]